MGRRGTQASALPGRHHPGGNNITETPPACALCLKSTDATHQHSVVCERSTRDTQARPCFDKILFISHRLLCSLGTKSALHTLINTRYFFFFLTSGSRKRRDCQKALPFQNFSRLLVLKKWVSQICGTRVPMGLRILLP